MVAVSLKKKTEKINLDGVVFPGKLDFSKKILPDVSFNEAVFLGDASFEDTEFNGIAEFYDTIFNGIVEFYSTTFNCNAMFIETEFRQRVDFLGSLFHGITNFDSAKFREWTDFEGTEYYGAAFFRNTFFKYALFGKSKFNESVTFEDAVFKNGLTIREAEFNNHADFGFSGHTHRNAEKIENYDNQRNNCISFLNASNAVFKSKVTFHDRNFTAWVDFSNCIFHKAPQFFGSILHHDTNFEKATFLGISSTSARMYRVLKQSMGNILAHREEAMFYALEQKCIRKNRNVSPSIRFFSWLYEKTSNYGQSVSRPFYVGFIVILTFTLIYSILGARWSGLLPSISWSLFVNSLLFTIKQSVSPFRVWLEGSTPAWYQGDLQLLQFIATIQSLLILSIFTVFLLALRWNFKRG